MVFHLEPVSAGPGIVLRVVLLGGSDTLEDGLLLMAPRLTAGLCYEKIAQAAERASRTSEVWAACATCLTPSVIILSGSVAECGSTA